MVGFGLGFIICVMSQRIQLGISIFDEANFPRGLVVGVVILKITSFAIVRIVGFDLIVAEVRDLVVNIWHLRFCIQVVMWLKTRAQIDGW
jgi:hypothetical protein